MKHVDISKMLSISKLEKLMASHGLQIVTYYMLDGSPKWLEVVSPTVAFLLYIPSKYVFNPPSNAGGEVYTIKYIDVDDEAEDTATVYGGNPDEHLVE